MDYHSHPFVSVIIPVYNDAERLKLCLEALENQTYPKTGYEVIVVDNASDEVADIKGVVAQFGQATAAYESTPGSYSARNKGISFAKGEVIAFTDADCLPASNWMEKGVYYLLNTPNCGLVAGKVNFFFKNPDKPTTVELYNSMTAFRQEFYIQQFCGGVTANLFTWRTVINQVGTFDERLKSFGDLEWGKRVFLAGYQQFYAADVEVKHPARYSWEELYKQTIRKTGGIYDYFIQRENSLIQRNIMFVSLLFEDLIPPVNFTITTFKNPDVKGFIQKTKVSLMLLIIRYVTAWEKIRLKFGGVSLRE